MKRPQGRTAVPPHSPPIEKRSAEVWMQGIRDVQAQSGGLMRLEIIRPYDAAVLMLEAAGGNVEARRTLMVVNDALDRIAAAPCRKPSLCGSCPRQVRKIKFAIAIATPQRDDATRVLAVAICERCATEPEDIERKALDAIRRLWPSARPVVAVPTHAAGNA